MVSLIIRLILLLFLSVSFVNNISYAKSTGYPQVMFIFDASGSMWGDAGGETKIDAARRVMSKVVPSLPPEVKVGLAVYGHRRKGDCKDIEIVIPPGSSNRDGIISYINKLSPKGKTPIADAISLVADRLKSFEDETTIVLISDGEETCNADPCGVVKRLKESGIKFVLHVVGFAVNAQQRAQLECLAKVGGGNYFSAENAATLLSAMETVKEEVIQKVEKAKTVTKKAVSKLGKLHITIPKEATRCLNTIKIIRKKDGKVIKTIKLPGADSTHPLLMGEYEIVLGYTNSNYKPDSEVSLGIINIKGGETAELKFGSLAVNIADSLKKMPAGAVIITSEDKPNFKFTTMYTGNDYYFYKTKPLPPGRYSFAVHYKRTYLYNTSNKPIVLASGIEIKEGRQSVVNIDTGIIVKKVKSSKVIAWELIPEKGEEAIIRIERAKNGDYPLWQPYAIPPGKYDLVVFVKGMSEPLTVGDGLVINKGELLQFDTGL